MTATLAPSGLVLIDKPASWSSFDVIRVLRKQLGQKSIGHAGTLDPFATGLLVVAVGQATRALCHLLHQHKTYVVRVVFGVASDTLDPEGMIECATVLPQITSDQISTVLQQFSGSFLQLPPVYSAKKIRGKRACDRIRKGEMVELKPVPVTCDAATLIAFGKESDGIFAGLPFADIRLQVGSGFYVRSFARDLGNELGTPAIAACLCREQVGRFHLAEALVPQQVTTADIRPLTEEDFQMPIVRLAAPAYADFCHGRAIPMLQTPEEKVAVFFERRWVGFAEVSSGTLHPRAVIATESA